MQLLRTPDERFAELPGFAFAPRYVEIGALRMHYLDEGPKTAPVALCLHGQPTWAYLYRNMIPAFLAAGLRVLAPDLFGFGRSDKPVDEDVYTFDFHRSSVMSLIEALDLRRVMLVCQDWGGLIGLTIPMDMADRFDRLLVMNTMLGTGDAAFWSDGKGNPVTPPSTLIANPNPVSGSVNRYTVDGNWSNCSDVFQPGVKPIVTYLNNLPYAAEPNCKPNHYYMLNNVNPGYLPNGALSGGNNVPPSSVRTIGDALMEKNISWAFYGGAFNDAVALSNAAVAANPSNPNLSAAAVADPAHALGVAYCQICNPFQYATSIMANPAVRQAHLKDTADLITAIHNNKLPAVSFGKPDGLLDGHPQSSKVDLFEAYVLNVLSALENNPELKADTAVFITWDEAGGYWDSGYQQSIDFFGDGPRIPTLILSPYSTGGKVNHNYADHVSLLKFIERNWGLQPLTNRSRDNLPNPSYAKNNEYVPTNSPALSDLFDAFDFSKPVTLSYTE